MIEAPWDTMTLIHHADHLAQIPGKRVLRYEVPILDGGGITWRFMEEFDTTEPVLHGMPKHYIEQNRRSDGRDGRRKAEFDRRRTITPYRCGTYAQLCCSMA